MILWPRFFSPEELEAAAIGRHEDLLVYFALSHFYRRKPYTELPPTLQRDVRFFFGNITKAKQQESVPFTPSPTTNA